jgi:hypothetical protein
MGSTSKTAYYIIAGGRASGVKGTGVSGVVILSRLSHIFVKIWYLSIFLNNIVFLWIIKNI